MTATMPAHDPILAQPSPAPNPSLPPDARLRLEPVDQADDWIFTAPKKGIRLRLPIIAALTVAVALAGVGAGATLKERASTTNGANAASAAPGANGGFSGNGFPGSGGFTAGTVTSVEGTTVHLTDANGQSVTVNVPETATITDTQSATVSDIAVGSSITVAGTTADGTTTARSISIAAGSTGTDAGRTPASE